MKIKKRLHSAKTMGNPGWLVPGSGNPEGEGRVQPHLPFRPDDHFYQVGSRRTCTGLNPVQIEAPPACILVRSPENVPKCTAAYIVTKMRLRTLTSAAGRLSACLKNPRQNTSPPARGKASNRPKSGGNDHSSDSTPFKKTFSPSRAYYS